MSNRIGNRRSIDDRGHGEENKGASTEYPERNPLDLIDEDKRPFVRRRIC